MKTRANTGVLAWLLTGRSILSLQCVQPPDASNREYSHNGFEARHLPSPSSLRAIRILHWPNFSWLASLVHRRWNRYHDSARLTMGHHIGGVTGVFGEPTFVVVGNYGDQSLARYRFRYCCSCSMSLSSPCRRSSWIKSSKVTMLAVGTPYSLRICPIALGLGT